MAAKVPNIIVGDIETGGFSPYKCAITEIALIAINPVTLEELGRYEAVIAPYKRKDGKQVEYHQAALDYSGMTMAKIEAGVPAKQVATEIKAFVKQFSVGTKKPVLCGHNFHKFDKPFIDVFLWTMGVIKLKKLVISGEKDLKLVDEDRIIIEKFDTPYQEYVEDTLHWTYWRFAATDIPNHKLGTACEFAEVPLTDAHRAMNDTEGNTKLMITNLKALRGSGEAIVEKRIRDEFRFE